DPADLEGAADLVEGVQVVAHQPAGLGDGSWASWSSESFRRVLWDMAGHSDPSWGSGCLSNFPSTQRAGGRLQCLNLKTTCRAMSQRPQEDDGRPPAAPHPAPARPGRGAQKRHAAWLGKYASLIAHHWEASAMHSKPPGGSSVRR